MSRVIEGCGSTTNFRLSTPDKVNVCWAMFAIRLYNRYIDHNATTQQLKRENRSLGNVRVKEELQNDENEIRAIGLGDHCRVLQFQS